MKYFRIEEFLRTGSGRLNEANFEVRLNIQYLVEKVLDPAREWFNAPIRINSGYRSVAVNDAVGGSATSQHLTGEAADISCNSNGALFRWIMRNCNFDQLIWEFGDKTNPEWIHVSCRRTGINRGEVLMAARDGNGKTVYRKIG